MKISAKITITAVKNREPYIIIYKCKELPLSLFSYQMLASTFDSDERSSYYKVYGFLLTFNLVSINFFVLIIKLKCFNPKFQ